MKSGRGLSIHLRLKHGIKRRAHECDQCDKRYSSRVELTTHKARVHSGLDPGKCSRCGKVFSTAKGLATHDNTCRRMSENRNKKKDQIGRSCYRCSPPKRFTSIEFLKKHIQNQHSNFHCNLCGQGFVTSRLRTNHMSEHHPVGHGNISKIKCQVCNKGSFRSQYGLRRHLRSHVVESWSMVDAVIAAGSPFRLHQTAHARFLRTFAADIASSSGDGLNNLTELHQLLSEPLTELLGSIFDAMRGPYKVFASLYVSFTSLTDDSQIKTGYILTNLSPVYSKENAEENANQLINNLIEQGISRTTSDVSGSQWILKTIDKIFINVCKYSSYMGAGTTKREIKIPDRIRAKGCLSYEESSDYCLFHCIFKSGVLGSRSQEVISQVTLERYPPETKLSGISRIEKDFGIAINVFSYEDDGGYIFPVRISQCVEDQVEEDEANDTFNPAKGIVNVFLYDSHFHLIRSFNRFAGSQGKRNNKYCFFCLNGFMNVARRNSHMASCRKNTPALLLVPPKENHEGKKPILKFTNRANCFVQPFIGYADFESLLMKPTAGDSSGRVMHNHVVFSYACVILGLEDKVEHQRQYVQRKPEMRPPAVDLLLFLIQTYKKVEQFIQLNEPVNLTDAERQKHIDTDICHICGGCFEFDECSDRVIDHDHITGRYRGAAHRSCNIMYRPSPWLTVFFHNLTSYDHHPILCAIAHDEVRDLIDDVSVIPLSSEKFTTLTITTHNGAKLRFCDSMRFMNASLDSLSQMLIKDEGLELLKWKFGSLYPLLSKKQVFPYEYFNSYDVLRKTELPDHSSFFNTLTGCNVSDIDYQHAKSVYAQTRCKNLCDYMLVYLWVDVLLLAEVFQQLRRLCHRQYRLDPCHYVSMPQLAFDAALLQSQIELELITDIDQILFLKAGIRGGISMISKRYSKANNPLMGPHYDPTIEPDKYILYHDINNLYGAAMCFSLPVSGFNWVPDSKYTDVIDELLVMSTTKSTHGYIFEVDLCYPSCLHDTHNDLPLAPERTCIDASLLSDYQRAHCDGSHSKFEKLVPHFYERERYVVHYVALKYYLEKGMKITKVHRVLSFNQSPWLKEYIEKNTKRRQQETSTFGRDFYKLMNNSVYGKTMENLWNRKEVKVCWKTENLLKFANKPWFQSFEIIAPNLSLFVMKKKKIVLNKPFYLGLAILDISKFFFYSNWYDGYLKLWPGNCKLLMCDTDSYIMELTCTAADRLTPYDDMITVARRTYRNKKYSNLLLDTSNFDANSEYEELSHLYEAGKNNKSKVGFVKDEMGNKAITRFAGIALKAYGIEYYDPRTGDISETLKAKGCPSKTLRESFNFGTYETLVQEGISHVYADVVGIESRKHQIRTYKTKKKCLTSLDTKRWFDRSSNYETTAFGHYKLQAQNQNE